MTNIRDLFFHLTPTTLAAIVADLDDNDDYGVKRARGLPLAAGYDNCGDEFDGYLDEARAERDGDDQRAEDESGYNGEVAAGLERFTR